MKETTAKVNAQPHLLMLLVFLKWLPSYCGDASEVSAPVVFGGATVRTKAMQEDVRGEHAAMKPALPGLT